ncbi:MAG TPA: hypothetical protein PKV98_04210 [Burkholderiaceae bacterium]|nr:hypothetical protein [Burkholderiaceae bacterium]
MQNFWDKCASSGCVVVPVMTYSGYGPDGNTHEEQFTGVKYFALPVDNVAVGPDYWFMLEEASSGSEGHETPDAALEHFLSTRLCRQ